MPESSARDRFERPSGKRILVSTIVAGLVALAVLVAFIWPAEYGRDPTGIGGLLGITGMSTAPTQTIELVDNVGGNENIREVKIPDFGDPVPLPNPNVVQNESTPPATRTVSVQLGPEGETEVKTQLREGKMIVFNWQVDNGVVYSDFHGHNPEFGSEFFVRYKEDQRGAPAGYGSLVAPFDGEHGWYWVNLEDHPVTITLTVTGYFDDIIDYSAEF